MARALARTPTLRPPTLTLLRSLTPCRPKSSRADEAATVIEIDLGSGSVSESGTEVEVNVGVVNRLEDAIHSIYAQKTAPDWLPFVPGSSYWVPPKSQKTAVVAADFVRLIKTTLFEPLTDDDVMSLRAVGASVPSACFVEGVPTKKRSKKSTVQSDDEE